MQAEPNNKNDLHKEWANFFALQYKRVSDPVGFSFERYRDELISIIRKILQYEGADINALYYRHKDRDYIRIKNECINGFPGGAMSLEEFIDRFMPSEYAFESIYDMGNPCEIKDRECTDIAVATEIWRVLSLEKKGMTATDVCNELKRKNGLIERIKKYLGIDLNEELDRNDGREKRERNKILYFFYMLEHRHYPNCKVLMLLDKPSMESIDNTFLGWDTHHGKILKFVKESLCKELSLEEKDRVYSAVANVSFAWDNFLRNARLLLDFLYDYGFDYSSTELLPSSIPIFMSSEGNQESTNPYPVERLYLTISQREYLGNLIDIAFINKIENSNDYAVPPELVEEMKSLRRMPVDFDNVEKHIKDNALRLSRYVYLGKKITKEDVRRIRTFAPKFQKFLKFCYRSNRTIDIQEISNELQLVSFLQALILDNQSEEFDYTYHGYQEKAKHMMRVQAALKNDNRVPDALQVYWVRKVTDRWYANVGKYNVRLKLRQIEQICDKIRKQILSQPTLDGMMAAHNFYMEQVDPGSFDVENQIQAVSHVVNFLHDLGFNYEDYGCKIRYSFLDPENWKGICASIFVNIQDAIQDHDPSCQIKCDTKGAAVKDAGFFLEFAFDYCQKTCALTRFDPLFG